MCVQLRAKTPPIPSHAAADCVKVQLMASDSEIDEPVESFDIPSTANTVVPRYLAALLDSILAMIIAVIAAKAVGDERLMLQIIVVVTVYLSYYFIPEALIGRTPGKLFSGLVVTNIDGGRSSWRQIAIRTITRLLEVNPLLLGAIPAALSVVFSKHHQRFGDKWAGTLVVASRSLRKRS
jgi:uncharacterized RDD family membrane protein YckC